jgi:predicted RNA-binding Zn ribbon-like protein
MGSQESQVAPGKLEIVRAFLNTWRIPNDTRMPEDALDTPAAMQRFYSTAFGGPSAPIVPEQALQLRADLRGLLGTGDVAVINRWLARQPVEVVLEHDGEGLPAVRYRPAGAQECRLCAALVALVVEAIAQHTWTRLKACPDCHWVFYDHTKNHNKVWCLMVAGGPQGRSCGSIAKVRRWRERQKRGEHEAEV